MSSTGEETAVDPSGTSGLIDLWKRSEYLKFQEHLGQVEEERTRHLRDELVKVKRIERKLKLKLVELENKERDLISQEAEVRRAREDTAVRLKRLAEEHQGAIQLIKEQHAAALKIEKDKLKVEEARRRAVELELSAKPKPNKIRQANGQKNQCDSEIVTLRERVRELETELKLKESAIEQAKDREIVLVKSRDHFRAAVLRMTCEKTCNDEVVFRLQQKRGELISSGLYREEDDVIRQLDSKIFKALSGK